MCCTLNARGARSTWCTRLTPEVKKKSRSTVISFADVQTRSASSRSESRRGTIGRSDTEGPHIEPACSRIVHVARPVARRPPCDRSRRRVYAAKRGRPCRLPGWKAAHCTSRRLLRRWPARPLVVLSWGPAGHDGRPRLGPRCRRHCDRSAGSFRLGARPGLAA